APPRTDALAKQAEAGAAAGAREMDRAGPERQAVERAPAPPAPAAAPDAAVGMLAHPSVKPLDAPKTAEAARRAENSRNGSPQASSMPVWRDYEDQPPEKWLERVDQLRRSGRDSEAREMLAEFRKRFPQHPVPAALDR